MKRTDLQFDVLLLHRIGIISGCPLAMPLPLIKLMIVPSVVLCLFDDALSDDIQPSDRYLRSPDPCVDLVV